MMIIQAMGLEQKLKAYKVLLPSKFYRYNECRYKEGSLYLIQSNLY